MTDFSEFNEALNARIEQRESNYVFFQDLSGEMVELFCRDIDDTISFIENECTDEQFYWLSEIFSDIARETSSSDFVDCIKRRLEDVDESTTSTASIIKCIGFAENALAKD